MAGSHQHWSKTKNTSKIKLTQPKKYLQSPSPSSQWRHSATSSYLSTKLRSSCSLKLLQFNSRTLHRKHRRIQHASDGVDRRQRRRRRRRSPRKSGTIRGRKSSASDDRRRTARRRPDPRHQRHSSRLVHCSRTLWALQCLYCSGTVICLNGFKLTRLQHLRWIYLLLVEMSWLKYLNYYLKKRWWSLTDI